MTKITLTPLVNLQNETTAVSAINANDAVIVTAFDNTLSRDGTSPNQMNASLDMNSNQILNLPAPSTLNSPLRVQDGLGALSITTVTATPGTSGHTVPFLDGNNTWSGTNTYTAATYFKSGRPYADVIAWGADPTGAADSTISIQNAINAVQSQGGGEVYFPPGTYKTTSVLNITVQGVTLRGASRLSSVIRTTSTTANIISIAVAFTKVISLGLVGTTATVSTSGAAIAASSAHASEFIDLYISDVWSGIALSSCTNVFINMIKVVNIYGSFGVSIAGGGGCNVYANQLDPVFWGNYTMTSGFNAWATSTGYTVNQVRSANGGLFVCTQGGTSSGGGSGPVITGFGVTVTDGTVNWLFIGSATSQALSISAGANSNYVSFNDMSGPWTFGVNILSSDGTVIYGNTIGQIIGTGINLGIGSTNCLIQGNVVSGSYGTFSAAIADSTVNLATGTKIKDNYINGSGWHGIILQSNHSAATGNLVQGYGQLTGAYGITAIANTTKFIINNNVIVPTSTGTIHVETGTSNFYNIIGNLVEGTAVVDGGSGGNKTITGNN